METLKVFLLLLYHRLDYPIPGFSDCWFKKVSGVYRVSIKEMHEIIVSQAVSSAFIFATEGAAKFIAFTKALLTLEEEALFLDLNGNCDVVAWDFDRRAKFDKSAKF